MDKLLIICGPTATGKTKLALELAKKFNGEIVSADSRQVYKGLDILTGKDLPENINQQTLNIKYQYKDKKYQLPFYEINGIKLWMYDVVKFDEEFSVGHYQAIASQLIKDIYMSGKLPIVVGGTGLYIRSLAQDLSTLHIPPDYSLRKKFENNSVEELQKYLQKVEFSKWENMNQSDRSNPRRLIRAIEVAKWQKVHKLKKEKPLTRDILWIGLTASTTILNQRIGERTRARWTGGALDEVKKLNVNKVPPILGLNQVRNFFEGKITAETAIGEWSKSEFDYAKRQITWFKKQPDVHWFDITDPTCASKVGRIIRKWYTNH